MKRAVALALITMTAIAGHPSPPIEGLWIHHDEWQYAPAQMNEDGDVHKVANAAVMNFCPNGVLGLATGVIYQSTRSPSVQIGASDGLSIYRGTWTRTDQGVAVEYKLVSAEFMNLLDDPVASARRTAELKVKRPGLEFPFTSHRGKIYTFEFIPAARYEKQVGDEFVECERRSSTPPPPKRPRTGGDRGDGDSQVRRRSSATSPNDSW